MDVNESRVRNVSGVHAFTVSEARVMNIRGNTSNLIPVHSMAFNYCLFHLNVIQ